MKLLRQTCRKILTGVVILMMAIRLSAQGSSPDFFQSIGKIYVVVAVVLVSFLGIVMFLIYLDRKLRKIEEQIGE